MYKVSTYIKFRFAYLTLHLLHGCKENHFRSSRDCPIDNQVVQKNESLSVIEASQPAPNRRYAKLPPGHCLSVEELC